jgi:uncharacterized protein YhbP (UPF0306 family)
MDKTLQKIESFISGHHVMTLATSHENVPQSCNLFYAYLPRECVFVVASDMKTEHMQNVSENPRIAGTIVLETKTIGKIEGLQFKGTMKAAADKKAREHYFSAFPYTRVLDPTLWIITPTSMKLTDNRLGFGKKLNWTRGA